MASKTTLNAKNLEALGAARLAALLMEISTGDAAAKRRLRGVLAAASGPQDAAREVGRRLASIARARSIVDVRKARALAGDLDTQRRAIVGTVAPEAPDTALDLIWRLMALADPVFARCDDSNGAVGDVFRAACADLGEIAAAARPDPEALADRVFEALQDNGYGQYDELIPTLAPVLGAPGLARLKAQVEALAATPVAVPDDTEAEIVGWGPRGPVHAHEMAERARKSAVHHALTDIADATGDVDGFIAQYPPETRRMPAIAARIAERLLAADRAEEALATLDAAETAGRAQVPTEWHAARLDALDALGRGAEAQAQRWARFERALSEADLRAYLKRLADFDDIDAEARALDHAARHDSVLAALHFLIRWPAPDRAAALVVGRVAELDGDRYEVLTPAAEALAERHPLAATLVLRAMIDFTLETARSSRYRHAARHLAECARLAGQIADFGAVEPHATYLARLRRDHGRKAAFWARAEAAGAI